VRDEHSNWALRPAIDLDAHWIAELRAVALRSDLERLGRFDPVRVRQRFRSAFDPALTKVVLVDGREVGCIAVRPDANSLWIEHFYLAAELQGKGVGSLVLRQLLADHGSQRIFRLNVLQGSRARALYERNGFVVESQDAVDVFMVRRTCTPHPPPPRSLNGKIELTCDVCIRFPGQRRTIISGHGHGTPRSPRAPSIPQPPCAVALMRMRGLVVV
jgi:GNAT superfamily N-acetyltransferase